MLSTIVPNQHSSGASLPLGQKPISRGLFTPQFFPLFCSSSLCDLFCTPCSPISASFCATPSPDRCRANEKKETRSHECWWSLRVHAHERFGCGKNASLIFFVVALLCTFEFGILGKCGVHEIKTEGNSLGADQTVRRFWRLAQKEGHVTGKKKDFLHREHRQAPETIIDDATHLTHISLAWGCVKVLR